MKFIFSATGAALARSASNGPAGDAKFKKFTDCKSINPIDLPNFGLATLAIFPLTGLFVFADRYFIQQFWPLGVDKTRLVMRFYFSSPPTSHLEEFARAKILASGRDVLSEDIAMTSTQQRGLRSGGIKQLHLGENELLIRFAHEMIDAWLNDEMPVPSEA